MRALAFVPLFLLPTFLLTACIDPATQTQDVQTPLGQPRSAEVQLLPKAIVSAHVDAFNKGDVAGMGKMQHRDIEWLNISGSTVTIEASGREALARNMEDYFKSPTRITGTLKDWSLNGDYVSVTETVRWKTASGEAKSQSALTVYQLENNLIRRVWYYPSVEN